MNFRILLYILIACIGFAPVGVTYGQSKNMDSLAKARQQTLDSTRAAQKKSLDSMREARLAFSDSLKIVRQRRSDSLAAIRKYKDSRHYKDSVTKSRANRLDSIKAVRTAYFDSLKTARKRVTDSIIAVRKVRIDSIKTIQKRRSDSLAVIRKYRESKRYKDSVIVVRKLKLDKLKATRKAYNDSVIAERRAVIDSMMAERKAVLDSATAVRKKRLDSMTAKRKVKSDSLAKVKEKKQKQQKVVEKQREEKKLMALELKIKKKREAWSNEKMLKKRWSVPRQIVQNTFTRYNYYFNTERKMDEALANMLRARKENYDSLLALFPFDPDRDSALLASDMDSIIQKASIGIQIHDPRTKWGDDMYLLMGQAYYYKGGYENAATSFKYIVSLRDKTKKKGKSTTRVSSRSGKGQSIAQAENKNMLSFMQHRSVHNEAILWLARTYTQSEQPGSAESVLDLLDTDPNFPESMKGRLALERSFMFLSLNDYSGAVKQLDIVAKDGHMPDWIRMRASFLAGQLYQEQGNYIASIDNFKQTLELHPKIDMDFYARKNLAYSSMYSGGSQDEAVATLKKVLKDGKYAPYYEQVYYVMGRLAANNGDNKDAISYLQKSIESPKSTKKQKALSFASLGGVHYKMGNYMAAKDAYDSVAALIASAPDDPIIDLSVKRALALGGLTKPLNTINDQDSLLALAALSERDQEQAVRKYIRSLEKAKADSAFLAENAGINAALQNAGTPDASDGGNAGRWYFANPVLMQQGFNEFKKDWGSRPLADNWRRLSAISSTGNTTVDKTDEITETVDEKGRVIALDARGIPTEASLLSFIPNTAEEKDAALKLIRRSYIEMANAYVKELEDYPPAIKALDTLDKRFPGHEYSAEAIYIRYVIALRQGKLDEAQKYSDKLISEYGDSKFANMVRPSESGAGLADMTVPVASYYEETYQLLMERQYGPVLMRVRDAQRRYSDPKYIKRFQVVEGTALAGTQEYDKADSLLTGFIRTYPSDSLRPWADAVLEYVKKTRPAAPVVPADSTKVVKVADSVKVQQVVNAAGTVPLPTSDVMDFPVDTAPPAAMLPAPPKEYNYKANDEHYVAVSIPAMEQRAAGVRSAISDFNTFKFGNLGLNSEITMLQPDQGVIVVKKFKNVGQAKIYLNSLRTTTQIFREYKPTEYEVFIISEPNYRKMTADKNIPAYLLFYKQSYK